MKSKNLKIGQRGKGKGRGYFKKVGKNKYTGASGKIFDLKQVQLFYANKKKFPK